MIINLLLFFVPLLGLIFAAFGLGYFYAERKARERARIFDMARVVDPLDDQQKESIKNMTEEAFQRKKQFNI